MLNSAKFDGIVFCEISTGILHEECACGNYNSSACARVSDDVRQLVRRSVGAPTAHACAGNGSHNTEDISPGRSGSPGEFLWTLVGKNARRGCGGTAGKESLRLDAGNSFSRADMVRRKGDAGPRAYPASRFARILS